MEKLRTLDDVNIITTDLAYLTASYLNCAKWIGFTVQMYLCMGMFSCCPCTCPSLCWNVCQRLFFFSPPPPGASAELFHLAGLLPSPGIYCFHNFLVWMLCLMVWIVETTSPVFLTFIHTNITHFHFAWTPVHQSLTKDTWHKHKIVQILAKIVIISVFDWVLHFYTVPGRLASGRAQ